MKKIFDIFLHIDYDKHFPNLFFRWTVKFEHLDKNFFEKRPKLKFCSLRIIIWQRSVIKKHVKNRTWPLGWTTFLRLHMKWKMKFFTVIAYFSDLFFFKILLQKKFWPTIFYRKTGRKMTFDFGGPCNRKILLFIKFRIVL